MAGGNAPTVALLDFDKTCIFMFFFAVQQEFFATPTMRLGRQCYYFFLLKLKQRKQKLLPSALAPPCADFVEPCEPGFKVDFIFVTGLNRDGYRSSAANLPIARESPTVCG